MSGGSVPSETVQHCREVLPTARRLVAEFPTNVHYRSELGILLSALGRSLIGDGWTAEAEIPLREAISILTQVSNPVQDSSRSEFTQLGITFGYQNVMFQSFANAALGNCYIKAGRLEDAEECFRRAFELVNKLISQYPQVRYLSIWLCQLVPKWVGVLDSMGRHEEAVMMPHR